jgi:hypothetical protein
VSVVRFGILLLRRERALAPPVVGAEQRGVTESVFGIIICSDRFPLHCPPYLKSPNKLWKHDTPSRRVVMSNVADLLAQMNAGKAKRTSAENKKPKPKPPPPAKSRLAPPSVNGPSSSATGSSQSVAGGGGAGKPYASASVPPPAASAAPPAAKAADLKGKFKAGGVCMEGGPAAACARRLPAHASPCRACAPCSAERAHPPVLPHAHTHTHTHTHKHARTRSTPHHALTHTQGSTHGYTPSTQTAKAPTPPRPLAPGRELRGSSGGAAPMRAGAMYTQSVPPPARCGHTHTHAHPCARVCLHQGEVVWSPHVQTHVHTHASIVESFLRDSGFVARKQSRRDRLGATRVDFATRKCGNRFSHFSSFFIACATSSSGGFRQTTLLGDARHRVTAFNNTVTRTHKHTLNNTNRVPLGKRMKDVQDYLRSNLGESFGVADMLEATGFDISKVLG